MPIDCQVIRSDRRTLALTISERGELIVRAPKRMPLRQVMDFVNQKERWIKQKQAEAAARASKARLRWADGEPFPYLGGTLTLRFAPILRADEQGGVLTLPAGSNPAAHARKWLRGRADALLPPRVADWARKTGLMPKRLAWSTAGKRWGSMSSDGTLRLNLALLHCPMESIDYVIVHELAHIAHPDHSPAFHDCVRRYLPDADMRRKRLRELSPCLMLLKEAARDE